MIEQGGRLLAMGIRNASLTRFQLPRDQTDIRNGITTWQQEFFCFHGMGDHPGGSGGLCQLMRRVLPCVDESL